MEREIRPSGLTNPLDRMVSGSGFIAALDQSGGSTPKALANYGISADMWSSEAEMFALIHRFRRRILTSPAFTSAKVLGAILFQRTMEGSVDGRTVPELLQAKGIVPFLKIDQGLQDERDGVRLMKPIGSLSDILGRAHRAGMFGTKARSLIRAANAVGIEAVVAQQFEIGKIVTEAGLLPILEPEYSLDARDRSVGERILREQILRALDRLPDGRRVMLKLSIPVEPNAYLPLVRHPRVARVAGLSGGYSREVACRELAKNDGMIASFGRALLEGLHVKMTDAECDAALAKSIDEIHRASVAKRASR